MSSPQTEQWINTSCNGCFSVCAIQVLARDNKVVASRGNPHVVSSLGKVCGKSMARVADLYDPNRITRPLLRTNPEKGIGVDPGWREISWDEALELVAARLGAVRAKDPRSLVIAVFDTANMTVTESFGKAFGTPNFAFVNATYCGGGLHSVLLNTLGTVNAEIDLEYCDHVVLWGAQAGLGANNNPTRAARAMATTRARGARLVVIDPLLGSAAAKADQWIPIIPGTDGAMALAVVNLLLNEYGLYDREFLARRTNGPYLTGPDGHYVRDGASRKPLVWDSCAGSARPYDEVTPGAVALEGTFTVADGAATTAFSVLKRHLLRWTPERAEEITGVPRKTICDFALAHGQAARIGAVIEVDGRVLPLRPAAIEFKRGVNAHKNAYFSCFAVHLINVVLGAVETPGGLLGTNANGPYGAYKAFAGVDGIIDTNLYDLADAAAVRRSYPPREASMPESFHMEGLFPASSFVGSLPHYAMAEPDKIKLPYRAEALIAVRTNFIKSYHDPRAIAAYLSRIPFMVTFARQLDEVAELADVVLPETHDYERYGMFPANIPVAYIAPGPGDWYMQINRPVVEPPQGARNWVDVLIELADRVGFLPALNERLNVHAGGLMAGWELDPTRRYTAEEICKRQINGYAAVAGVQDPMAQLDATGKIDLYTKPIEEAYVGAVLTARIPIYLEHFIDVGKSVESLCAREGFDWIEHGWYSPVPDWHPCPAHEQEGGPYDLFLANGKAAILSHSYNAGNPWIDDVTSHKRYAQYVLLHTTQAARLGLKDEDEVYVESAVGRVRGRLRVTECVHPRVVGTFGNGGGWAKGRPIAFGKGVHSNSLIPYAWNMIDPISGQIDTCARVRVYKAEE